MNWKYYGGTTAKFPDWLLVRSYLMIGYEETLKARFEQKNHSSTFCQSTFR